MFKYLLFFLTLLTAQAHSFTLSDAMIDAEIRKVNGFVSADSNGIKVNVTGKGYAASAPYFQTTTTVPKPTFMSYVRGNMKSLVKRSPYYIGWLATMAAAGWVIDELTGQMSKPSIKIVGPCSFQGGAFPFATGTPDFCANFASPYEYYDLTLVSGKPAPGANLLYSFKYIDPATGSSYTRSFYLKVQDMTSEIEPITDAALYDSLVSDMIKNPTAAADAFMVPGAYPYPVPQLFPNPLKNIPGVSEADYPALDCYFKGNLQSSNPGGACYVTESEYQRISALGEKIKKGETVEGQISSANDKLKDPLTQAQLEETLNKLGDIGTDGVTDDASKIYDEGFKQLNESILADALPGMPELVPLPQFQTGSCRSLTLNFSFAGQNITKEFPGKAGCEQIEKMKEFLGWFLAAMVVMTLIFTALKEAN
ncbi:hypothetical protein [Aeromonas sp. FDAARGOS 1407]|uniref:hypothetical protein n=1 Tax=Aeromonas TaxID=642 RepID=UPI001C24FBE7|nr:hypothetical protein [Aeromonas sp. FDAARGOS 1407]QXC33028.1 hypothetical protein I6L37_15725 [Aeromonas sp. FDAARGOS 1407]QXC33035.1 hypothetical protein I6L37_15760 [Aeromonas sp. FDAARGOS 1407]